ncbi:hypothetical protein ACFVXW_05780 [Streptomyces sp. NPDC058251]|uniref:hypothetical protein n=1 Tax=unclassified Streptomyces TaxID=2593676 RepID=UPI0036F009E6
MRVSETGGADESGAVRDPGAVHGPGTGHGAGAGHGAGVDGPGLDAGSGPGAGAGPGAVRRLGAPALANLLIGLAAIVPGLCLRWLLTKYPSVGCGHSVGCGKAASHHSLGMMTGAVLGGGFVLGMVLVVDFLVPHQEGGPVGTWLSMALLIPAPFVVGQALGWI